MTEHILRFKVIGEPIPMPRPRTVTKNGKTWTFSGSKSSRQYMKDIKQMALNQSGKHHFDSVILKIYMNTNRDLDVDNVAKSVMDALTGILWDNDKVIWNLVVVRLELVQDQKPCTEVEVIGEEPGHVQTKIYGVT